MAVSYTCIIADDDEIDRLTTLSFVRKYPHIQVKGVFASAEEALNKVNFPLPDIAFLDVDMPGMSGLELRKKFMNIPACIFITAYPDYAVEGFDLEALDFLVKPIQAERFQKAIHRIDVFMMLREKAGLLEHSLGADTIFIKEGHQQVKIHLHDIIYLEALKDYTQIITGAKKYCVLSSLGNILKEKEFESFIRVHKSFAVQKNYIEQIKAQELIVKNVTIPVGRSFKEKLLSITGK